MLAAISAAEEGADVLLIEKTGREGRKMLISGKGRCNITNSAYQSVFYKKIYPKPKFLKYAFSQFFSKDIIDLLEKNGLKTKTERGGRVFPESDKAKDVTDTLLKIIKSYDNIDILIKTKLIDIFTEDNIVKSIKIKTENKEKTVFCNTLILATGGKSYPATGSSGDGFVFAEKLGHKIIKPLPALVPLVTEGNITKKLQGLSLKNINASLFVNGKKTKEEFGEMLFAHFGLTGPVILTLSGFAVEALDKNFKTEINIDLKPALNETKLDLRLQREINDNGKKQIRNVMKSLLPSKLIPVILQIAEIDEFKPCNQISSKERKRIKFLLKNLRFNITGHRGFKEAIITRGGIDTNEINSRTMMSEIIKNLYFAGEIINLDAETGGYNFQIAFSTGYLAGKSAAETSKNQ